MTRSLRTRRQLETKAGPVWPSTFRAAAKQSPRTGADLADARVHPRSACREKAADHGGRRGSQCSKNIVMVRPSAGSWIGLLMIHPAPRDFAHVEQQRDVAPTPASAAADRDESSAAPTEHEATQAAMLMAAAPQRAHMAERCELASRSSAPPASEDHPSCTEGSRTLLPSSPSSAVGWVTTPDYTDDTRRSVGSQVPYTVLGVASTRSGSEFPVDARRGPMAFTASITA